MFQRTLSADDIARVRQEREEADRKYNDALTLLDHAIVAPPVVPQRPPAFDDATLPAINESVRIVDPRVPGTEGGIGGRLAAFVWRLVAPVFDRQQRFNASLVEHLNRNVAAERQSRDALGQALALLGDHLAAVAAFESRLIQFLQQITPYVDTKDRDLAVAVARDPHQQAAVIEETIALVQQQQIALKREVARVAESVAEAGDRGPLSSMRDGGGRQAAAVSGPDATEAYKYLCFEGQFRGTEDAIRRRFEEYGQYFAGASDVLDVGCGRGEFLDLLGQRGVSARGLDPNPDMVEQCRARGLKVSQADAVGYLQAIADGSLGGLFAAQVVEHLDAAYLVRFLTLAYEKLRPASRIVLETINVDCWSAFFGPYLRDLTHVHPVPSDTLRFLLQASGFQRLQVLARSPVKEDSRLRRIPPELAVSLNPALVAAFNANTDRINGLLFTHLDYAIVGERL